MTPLHYLHNISNTICFLLLIALLEQCTALKGRVCNDSLGSYCCSDSEDRGDGVCVDCDKGFTAPKIREKCRPCSKPSYGFRCSYTCKCRNDQRCDHVKGCVDIPTTTKDTTLAEQSTWETTTTTSDTTSKMTHRNTHTSSLFKVSSTDRRKNQGKETKSDFSEREVIIYTALVACVLVVTGLCYLVNKYRIMLHSKQLKIKEESLKNKTVKKKDEVLEMEDNNKDDDDDDSLYDVINESEIKDRVLPTNHAYLEIIDGQVDSQVKKDDYLTPISSLSRNRSSRNIQLLYHYPQIHRCVSDNGSSSESVVRTGEYLNPYLPLRELYTSISHRYEIPRLYGSLKSLSELRGKYLNSKPHQDVNNTNQQAFKDKNYVAHMFENKELLDFTNNKTEILTNTYYTDCLSKLVKKGRIRIPNIKSGSI